ncbi:hypothetical protein FSP39_000727 [Pinctada imbricata]|uniref:DNA 5'-3' helicase n=1 Tax=Pinctada imbricata TaxID=66713 RepID=A0AA89C4N2_PINIB|nr:hypothetical protein FSP39_000727 [Pinctada imbricata]
MTTERRQMIHGVEVVFPCKPYPSQFSMMEKVIKGIERRQNCLLESPTGSGKSLALLCSALAWQTAELAKKEKEESTTEEKNVVCTCGKANNAADQSREESFDKTKELDKVKVTAESRSLVVDDDDDDFRDPGKQFRTPVQALIQFKQSVSFCRLLFQARKHVAVSYGEIHTDKSELSSTQEEEKCTCHCMEEKSSSRKVPKIYFGTRTHKQVAQITKELKKTAYRGARMTILAAREHTCIHPEVSKMKSKNDGCKELLDGPGCRFNDRVKKIIPSQLHLKSLGLSEAWDIEDLAALGKQHKVCPYFGSRSLKRDADIIFCPYNYLIDPVVRNAMEIHLKDQIVILDEAHNMEDSAREAASESIKEDQLQKAIGELDEMIRYDIKKAEHLRIRQLCSGLLKLILENLDSLQQMDYDNEYKHWSGFDIVARLDQIGAGPKHFPDIEKCYGKIMEDIGDREKIVRDMTGKEIKLSSATLQCLEHIFKTFFYLYKHDLKFVPDYRMAIVKSKVFVKHQDTDDTWLNPKQRGRGRGVTNQLTFQHALNFWCMNPGVAFSDFDICRCVVLTSGTLSPMSSFESELGVPFPIKLEASHVIEDKQVWVGAIGHGPNGSSLQCVYKTMETWTFQDELGALVLKVCLTVPNGVLCFLPSYNALDKFKDRWLRTGVWNKIQQRKRIIVEPRASVRVDFEEVMRQFYDTINNTSVDNEDEHYEDRDGALFIAVCRGKVSEGLDFTDDNARAVITVGIPFPNFKDVQVKLKREYNDAHRASRGLLSGSEWYEIQAFRALNQALGRCIRHRKDWGALILVDERFVKNSAKYCKGLSKWVRNKVLPFHDCQDAMTSIEKFTNSRMKDMPVVNPDTSFIPSTPSGADQKVKGLMDTPLTSTPHSKGETTPWNNLPTHPFFTPFKPNKPEKTPDTSVAKKTFQTEDKTKKPASYSLLSPTHVNQNPGYQNAVAQSQVVRPTIGSQNQLTIAVNQPQPTTISQKQTQVVVQNTMMKQVMDIINTPGVPKDKPYYIILNEGTPQRQMFLVEPPTATCSNDKNPQNVVGGRNGLVNHHQQQAGLTSPQQQSMLSPTHSQSLLLNTSSSPMDISSESSNIASSSVLQQSSSVNSATKKSLGDNKFYKFHQKNTECSTPKVKQEPSASEHVAERSQTPVLFNNTEEDGTQVKDNSDKTCGKETVDGKSKVSVDANKIESRKPLFKLKKTVGSASKSLDNSQEDDSEKDFKTSKSSRIKSALSRFARKETKEAEESFTDNNVANTSDIVNEKRASKCEVKEEPEVGIPDPPQMLDINDSIVKQEEEGDGNDEVETLRTRRGARGVKRRQQANTRQKSKRACGVDFLDGIDDTKENKVTESSSLKCAACGKILVHILSEHEKRRRYPSFLKSISNKRNAEVIYCSNLSMKGTGLKAVSTCHNGVRLDSTWEADTACCIQYVQCQHCVTSNDKAAIVGARIVATGANPGEFKEGQLPKDHQTCLIGGRTIMILKVRVTALKGSPDLSNIGGRTIMILKVRVTALKGSPDLSNRRKNHNDIKGQGYSSQRITRLV